MQWQVLPKHIGKREETNMSGKPDNFDATRDEGRERSERTVTERADKLFNDRERTRDDASLNRIRSRKLDIFDPNQLNSLYEYRWVNDTDNRIMSLYNQYWEFVGVSEIANFSSYNILSESDGRIRTVVGTDKIGHPVYAFFMRKQKVWIDEERKQEERERMSQLESQVKDGDAKSYAVRNSNPTIGGVPQRRTGSII